MRKNCTTLALCTFVCKELSYNIKGTPRWQGISKGLYTNDALCLPTTSHRRTQRKKVHHKLPCFHTGNNALLRLACEGRLSIMCSASSQRHTTALSMCTPPINYFAASIPHCTGAFTVWTPPVGCVRCILTMLPCRAQHAMVHNHCVEPPQDVTLPH